MDKPLDISIENNMEVYVSFSDDETEAYITLSPLDKTKKFTKECLKAYVKNSGITLGIKEDVIGDIAENSRFNEKICVAESFKPAMGKDGWFEFLFPTEIDDKPIIRKDGSVDYSKYGHIPTVTEGQLIVKYHPAVQGHDGLSLLGRAILSKKTKDLPRLTGKGFTVSEDGLEYYAKFMGKIKYEYGKLIVEKELVIDGDVNNTTKDVQFPYDIHIHGNVLSGVSVVSENGGIVVDGYVEAAQLIAKKDVIIKDGMQGNQKGKIVTNGSVSGKFFEQTSITCKGDVNTNAIMNCYIDCGNDLIVSGKFGVIIGGVVSATQRLSAKIVGNMSGVTTMIKAGSDTDMMALYLKTENKQGALREELGRIIDGLAKLDLIIKSVDDSSLIEKRKLLMRAKVEKDALYRELDNKKQEIAITLEKVQNARITIDKAVYPGTTISINGMKVQITDEISHVEYARRGSGIISYSIQD